MLAQRVLSAVVLAPLLLLAAAAGDGWFLAAAAVGSIAALWEFYSLLHSAGFYPLWPFGVVLNLAFLFAAYLPATLAPTDVLAACFALSLIYLIVRQRLEGSLRDWAVTWLPPLYVGLLLAYLVSLRQLPAGDRWIYLVLGVAWATDTVAYFVGRAFGHHPFFPRISPRKSLEGAIGGLAGGIVCGTALAMIFGWDVGRLLPLSALGAVAAEIGDLAESFIKRQLGAKDASRVIPGHGGILDRLDSLLFVGITVYFWAIWVGGAR